MWWALRVLCLCCPGSSVRLTGRHACLGSPAHVSLRRSAHQRTTYRRPTPSWRSSTLQYWDVMVMHIVHLVHLLLKVNRQVTPAAYAAGYLACLRRPLPPTICSISCCSQESHSLPHSCDTRVLQTLVLPSPFFHQNLWAPLDWLLMQAICV